MIDFEISKLYWKNCYNEERPLQAPESMEQRIQLLP